MGNSLVSGRDRRSTTNEWQRRDEDNFEAIRRGLPDNSNEPHAYSRDKTDGPDLNPDMGWPVAPPSCSLSSDQGFGINLPAACISVPYRGWDGYSESLSRMLVTLI
jgi:hypothetical protein